jgi:hypothetical protein
MYRLLSRKEGLPWVWSQRRTIIKIHSRYIFLLFECATCDVKVEVVAELDKWLLNRGGNEDRGHGEDRMRELSKGLLLRVHLSQQLRERET